MKQNDNIHIYFSCLLLYSPFLKTFFFPEKIDDEIWLQSEENNNDKRKLKVNVNCDRMLEQCMFVAFIFPYVLTIGLF